MGERQLRIIHCLRAPVGGLFRHVRDLARTQAERGHLVGVICDANANDQLTAGRLAEIEPSLALGLQRVAMSRDLGPSDVAAMRRVREFARNAGVDILHGHGAKGGAYARLAARSLVRSGTPALAYYTPHGGSLHYGPRSPKGIAYMAAERFLARWTAGIVFESGYASRVFAAKVGAPPCPTRVIYNGLAATELVPVAPVADAADILFVGELRHLKGVDVLLEALSLVRHQHPCRALIVGAGPDTEMFQRQAAVLGLGDSVRFVGPMPAREAFARGHVLVVPSRAESLPYVVLEGAAARLPLVATCVGGVPEIVEGTDTPLVAPGDAAGLAAGITEVLSSPDQAAARASRLAEAVAHRFSVDGMTDGVLGFYAEGLGRAAAAVAPSASLEPARQPV
jgi:glycosyltransferase involved in cell wall biosynthesis